jgi:hypothetical protein
MVPRPSAGHPVVCLGEERENVLSEGRVTRVQDRDPELLAVDGMGEKAVERRVVRVRHQADKSLERRPSDAEVQALLAALQKHTTGDTPA